MIAYCVDQKVTVFILVKILKNNATRAPKEQVAVVVVT
jgi:hypothetical protein